MDIGIGLPNSLDGVRGPELVEWAKRAEGHGFSVLGTIGRIAYGTHEELIALAAAAGATERIELMTSVLVAPPRQAVLLAKQAATLQAVSGGRFRLGVGIGGRDDDWTALSEEPTRRGAKLDATIGTCRAVWSGDEPAGVMNPVGPPDACPIVLGGFAPPSFERAGRLGDGFVAGPMPPEAVRGAFDTVRSSAEAAGRATPTLYAARYVAIGDDVAAEADANAAAYYGFAGTDMVDMITGSILRSADEVRSTLDELAEAGAVETCLWPMAAGMGQVERIAEAALS